MVEPPMDNGGSPPDSQRDGAWPDPDVGAESRSGGFIDGAVGVQVSDSDRWKQLHNLLLGPEVERIEKLEKIPRTPRAKDVAKVLAEANARGAHGNAELAHSLAPTVEGALALAARRNPDGLARALEPAMGAVFPAILKAGLRRMGQSLVDTDDDRFFKLQLSAGCDRADNQAK